MSTHIDVPVSAAPIRSEDGSTRAHLVATLNRMREAQRGRPAPSAAERIAGLERLARVLITKQDAIAEAIARDFGHRSHHETLVAEVFVTVEAARYAARHVRRWMAHERRSVAWYFLPGRAMVHYQPLGVVGIISPWNYPFYLALGPLVSALAAGNRVMIKPSEYTPATSELLKVLLGEVFPSDQVAVITGGVEVGEAFSRLPFDHLVFTGSTRVGKVVMRAAAENLVPVTLELGGKSPAIIGDDFPIETAALRVMYGKLLNAGQTCLSPDYVLVPETKREAFVEAFGRAVEQLYPKLNENPDYTSIINDRQYARLVGYLEDARKRGLPVVELNPAKEKLDPSRRRLAPHLVIEPGDDAAIMQDEIFGPLLPVKTYKTLDDALRYVNDHPRPLALYYFGYQGRDTNRVLNETTSGGVTINDTVLHVAQDDIPFGGVGPSGMGHYHAFEGFETMSRKKAVFVQGRVNAIDLMRPPYGALLERFIAFVLGR